MSVLPNQKLFVPATEEYPKPVDYSRDASIVSDSVSLVVLSAKIAEMGSYLILDRFGPGIRNDKKVSMEAWLAKQKLHIPLDSRHTYSYGTGPITEDAVREYLDMWNFRPDNIDINIVKHERRWRYGCYVVITLSPKAVSDVDSI